MLQDGISQANSLGRIILQGSSDPRIGGSTAAAFLAAGVQP